MITRSEFYSALGLLLSILLMVLKALKNPESSFYNFAFWWIAGFAALYVIGAMIIHFIKKQ